jgi:[pyruvate, water dikinase]-phosphate phosphotransferase / [pyruvate, water dikinase] kinase
MMASRYLRSSNGFGSEYFRRIDALNYTMMHDDGQLADDLEEADVVLIGVSRTSKTPTPGLTGYTVSFQI